MNWAYQPLLPASAQQTSGTSYQLTADVGSFALTGEPASGKAARRLPAAAGSIALSGESAAPKLARRIANAGATFALTGQDAAFSSMPRLAASSGAFALTGLPAGLKTNRRIPAGAGSFALSGEPAQLGAPTRRVSAAAGAIALSGNAAALVRACRLLAGKGDFQISGSPARHHGQFDRASVPASGPRPLPQPLTPRSHGDTRSLRRRRRRRLGPLARRFLLSRSIADRRRDRSRRGCAGWRLYRSGAVRRDGTGEPAERPSPRRSDRHRLDGRHGYPAPLRACTARRADHLGDEFRGRGRHDFGGRLGQGPQCRPCARRHAISLLRQFRRGALRGRGDAARAGLGRRR